MLFKYILFIYFKLDMENLFNDKLNFWDYRKFDRSTIKRTTTTYKIINLAQNSSIVACLAAILLYYLKPAFNSNDTYIIDAWIFVDYIIIDVTVLACQYYFILATTVVVIGYDSIYLSFCTHVLLQVKLLKCRLEELSKYSYGSAEKEIRKCIRHHQLLIS